MKKQHWITANNEKQADWKDEGRNQALDEAIKEIEIG